MNIELLRHDECTGCGLCSYVCPQQCIVMQYDEEGFRYPRIKNSLCIHCGKCAKMCPSLTPVQKSGVIQGYAALLNEARIEKVSSSGGMFPALAEYVLKRNGIVFGAIIDENLEICHIGTENRSDIIKMQGSKYVQSNIESCYTPVEKALKNHQWVLFTGTPCQVAAIKRMTASLDCSTLVLVDLICHGVPSPQIFREHIIKCYGNKFGVEAHREKTAGESSCYRLVIDENAPSIRFREKTAGESSCYRLVIDENAPSIRFREKTAGESSCFRYKFGTNQKTLRVYAEEDAFYNSFLHGRNFRFSCYSCQYACTGRVGDITIGDCNNYAAYTAFPYGKLPSSIFINTSQGELVWNEISRQMTYCAADVEKEQQLNEQLHKPFDMPEVRTRIYKDFSKLSQNDLDSLYAEHLSFTAKGKRFIKRLLPLSLKGKIKRSIHEIKSR